MELSSTIFLILISLTTMKCSIIEKCKSEGQRIPDPLDPSKFYLCHHFTKTNNWHSYPFHCNKGLKFDSITQDCISNGKTENSGTGTSISNVPIFNGIARLIRSVSGFPSSSSKEGDTENSDIILSLASSIRSLATTVEKLAAIQFQKSGPCLAPPPAPTTTTTTSRPVQEIKLERLPIYEIFKPVITVGEDVKPESYEHTIVQVPVPNVDSTTRLDVNTTEKNVIIEQVQSTTTSAPETSSTAGSSTTAKPVTKVTSTEEDYSASEEHSGVPQSPAFPQPGNNLFDFLFTNIFKRPHYQQRRPISHGNIHKNRLPAHFLDHRFEPTTARNLYLNPIHHREPQRHPIRIPVLQHTNSPHNAFPGVEQHPLPNGGKLVNLVSLFNHLSGIGTPVPIGTIEHQEIEDSDHYIVPVPVPNEIVKPVKTTPVLHIETSTVSTSLPSSASSSTQIINSIPEGTEEDADANNSSRLNDRKPRM